MQKKSPYFANTYLFHMSQRIVLLGFAALFLSLAASAQEVINNIPLRDWNRKMEIPVAELQQALGLAPDVAEKVSGLQEEFLANTGKIEAPKDLVGRSEEAQLAELITARDASLQDLLTAEQFAKLLELRAERAKKTSAAPGR